MFTQTLTRRVLRSPLVGLLTLVPYVSGAVGVPTAMLLLALEPSGGTVRSAWWWIVFAPMVVTAIAQFLDDYVLSPKIQGKTTNMDTPTILFASLAGAADFYGVLCTLDRPDRAGGLAGFLRRLLRNPLRPRWQSAARRLAGGASLPLPSSSPPPPPPPPPEQAATNSASVQMSIPWSRASSSFAPALSPATTMSTPPFLGTDPTTLAPALVAICVALARVIPSAPVNTSVLPFSPPPAAAPAPPAGFGVASPASPSSSSSSDAAFRLVPAFFAAARKNDVLLAELDLLHRSANAVCASGACRRDRVVHAFDFERSC